MSFGRLLTQTDDRVAAQVIRGYEGTTVEFLARMKPHKVNEGHKRQLGFVIFNNQSHALQD